MKSQLVFDYTKTQSAPALFEFCRLLNVGRLVRLIRFAMLIRVIVTQRKHFAKASRLMVSENKRRYQKDGFDLDLCYITGQQLIVSLAFVVPPF